MTRKNKYNNSPHVAQHRMGTDFFYGDPGGIRTPDPRLRSSAKLINDHLEKVMKIA